MLCGVTYTMRCGATYTKLGYFSKRGVFPEVVGGTSVPPAAVTRTEVAASLLRERDAVWGNIYHEVWGNIPNCSCPSTTDSW